MAEAWLETNRRALAMAMILPGLMAVASIVGLVWSVLAGQHWGLILLFSLLTVAPLWMIGQIAYAMAQPRIGFHAGELLVYFQPAQPVRIPIEIVEVFFLGQGPSELPALRGREPETQNVVIRLAESAADWKHRDVPPSIGHWCESYITIRGSWCEPITHALMQRMNQRLIEVQRERKQSREQQRAVS